MGDRVKLAYCHDGEWVGAAFHRSLINLLAYDISGPEPRLTHEQGMHGMRCSTLGLIEGRNTIARSMLDPDAPEWLFWLDTDMGYEPDTLDRLLETADPKTRPIVGGLCFASQEYAPDGWNGFLTRLAPTIYVPAQRADGLFGTTIWWDYPRDEVVECTATGSACIVIHRDVFREIAAHKAKHGDFYDRVTIGDVTYSEDLSFCFRAKTLGYPVHVDTRIKTTHQKTVWIGEHLYQPPVKAPAC